MTAAQTADCRGKISRGWQKALLLAQCASLRSPEFTVYVAVIRWPSKNLAFLMLKKVKKKKMDKKLFKKEREYCCQQ